MTLRGKEILVIDDMKDARKIVALILESEGAIVFQAETVGRGLELAASKALHLIITDLNMPERNGFDFLKERRKVDSLKSIPTIVLSGLNDRNSVTEAIALGAEDYVLKPIRSSILIQKVRKRLKDQSFLTYQFGEIRPVCEVSLFVDVFKVSEVGVQIDASVKLSPDDTITLSGELMNDLNCAEVIIRSGVSAVNPIGKGRYLNDLNFLGIAETAAKRIRSRLKEWK